MAARLVVRIPVGQNQLTLLVQAMFGWVGDHTSGLFADEQEVIDDADMSGERSIEDKYARQSGNLFFFGLDICCRLVMSA